ncbi:Sua5 YciO YrdC YwlC family protein [Campylobacter sp. 19-13652]|uniref:Sua5 YciO YrdC YwlC family protein n=1 Tax=Campylobacter sp. 19-13652 TaxID=2840180 RepID=UPI001C78E877|nr:Sua5 YciO YrdC YwlC family protein [Campylobacter sp. 19-13652]BCX78678.1 hypothetical protein LBC_01400 [Campylobacter sp. 19-13652]
MTKPKLYLAQTDTTAGLLSQDLARLNLAKARPASKPCLITLPDFARLREIAKAPVAHRRRIRASKKTTYLYPNGTAARVVNNGAHQKFLSRLGWAFSSSANRHGDKFDESFAKSVADEVVSERLFEGEASSMFRLSRTRLRRLR